MTATTSCPPLCKRRCRNIALHLHRAHGAEPIGPAVTSMDAIHTHLANADDVAAERLADAALAGASPRAPRCDRLAAAIICIRRGNRYAAPERLRLNGQTVTALNRLVASGRL